MPQMASIFVEPFIEHYNFILCNVFCLDIFLNNMIIRSQVAQFNHFVVYCILNTMYAVPEDVLWRLRRFWNTAQVQVHQGLVHL